MSENSLQVSLYSSTSNTVNLFTSNQSIQITGYSIQNPVSMIHICYLRDFPLPAHAVADSQHS